MTLWANFVDSKSALPIQFIGWWTMAPGQMGQDKEWIVFRCEQKQPGKFGQELLDGSSGGKGSFEIRSESMRRSSSVVQLVPFLSIASKIGRPQIMAVNTARVICLFFNGTL